jgi:hypothetical protein
MKAVAVVHYVAFKSVLVFLFPKARKGLKFTPFSSLKTWVVHAIKEPLNHLWVQLCDGFRGWAKRGGAHDLVPFSH